VDCAIDSVTYNGTAEEWEKVIDNNSGIKNEDLVFLKQSEQSNG
jgi:hypothetical protein